MKIHSVVFWGGGSTDVIDLIFFCCFKLTCCECKLNLINFFGDHCLSFSDKFMHVNCPEK